MQFLKVSMGELSVEKAKRMLLNFIKAREFVPVFEEEFLDANVWQVLQERWAL